jgi:hypothetical protein
LFLAERHGDNGHRKPHADGRRPGKITNWRAVVKKNKFITISEMHVTENDR